MTPRETAAAAPPSIFPEKIVACLKAPGGEDDTTLEATPDGFRCVETDEFFPFIEGVPSLYAPPPGEGVEVTTRVKSFYEEHPFPSYEGLEEFGELVAKGSQNPFSARLLDAIGYNKTVLECGCGTGQLTHFLQLNNNQVLGVDISLSSLRLAVEHKRRNDLVRSAFAQMNIFELAVKDNAFDVVIAHGVLHHTFDARRAFAAVVRKLKPGGVVMVGLYNRYARVPTWLRSKIIGLTGGNIDYVVRNRIRDPSKAEIWIKDQYYNPHETWHSIGEVLEWFEVSGIDYLNCSPPILGTDGEDAASLFQPTEAGDPYRRVVTQLSWIATIAREGALFEMIGRKRA
ncbi:MAG: class I SAM-dependent methyltransferase [Rhodospirillales bacterium]|nr:class I SAM-dependent methyltransferase [Rhodospirillales bacterium]